MDPNHLRPPSPLDRSESELSDINDLPTTALPPTSEQEDVDMSDHADHDAIQAMATSEMDESEDASGEEDADFSEDMSPAEDMDGVTAHNASSSSSEHSSRSRKRKASFDDDEYIKANPELYGLRRSVCLPSPDVCHPC